MKGSVQGRMNKTRTTNQVSVMPKPAASSTVRSSLPGARTGLRASKKALTVEVTTASPPLLILLRVLRLKRPWYLEASVERPLASFERRKFGANVMDTFYKRYTRRIRFSNQIAKWKGLHDRRSGGGRPQVQRGWWQHRRGPGCSRARGG